MANDKEKLAAFGKAGKDALRVVETFGRHDGTEILKTISGAYIRALAAVEGWDATFQFFQRLHAEFVPTHKRKKRYPIRVIEGGKSLRIIRGGK